MTSGISNRIKSIREKIAPILKKYGVQRAAIFGSTARGTDKTGSDIDVLVDLPLEKGLWELITLKYELEAALGKTVDLLEYSTIHPLLKSEILREQVPILP